MLSRLSGRTNPIPGSVELELWIKFLFIEADCFQHAVALERPEPSGRPNKSMSRAQALLDQPGTLPAEPQASERRANPRRTQASPSATPVPAGRPRVHLPAIDGFRGFAALYVLAYHVLLGSGRGLHNVPVLRAFFASGYLGVDVFFVISGFVLFLPAALNHGDLGRLRNYAARRIARIAPAYWVSLAVVILFFNHLRIPGLALPPTHQGWLNLAVHMAFLHQFFAFSSNAIYRWSLPDLVIWTLALEFCFYLLLPVFARWFYRHPFVGLSLALIWASNWKWLALSSHLWLRGAGSHPWGPLLWAQWTLGLLMQFPTYMGHFALGMTAAWIFVRLKDHRFRRQVGWAAPVVALGAAAALAWLAYSKGVRSLAGTAGLYDNWARTGGVAVAFAVLLLAVVLAPRWFHWPASNRLSRGVGEISYGIYLFNAIAIEYAVRILHYSQGGTTQAFERMFLFTIGVSVSAGIISFVVVEQPARSLAAWYCRRHPSTRQPAPQRVRTAPAPAVLVPALAGGGVAALVPLLPRVNGHANGNGHGHTNGNGHGHTNGNGNGHQNGSYHAQRLFAPFSPLSAPSRVPARHSIVDFQVAGVRPESPAAQPLPSVAVDVWVRPPGAARKRSQPYPATGTSRVAADTRSPLPNDEGR
jgi:peptidoglycan/LPS O-acetylase OafA/YrhL